MTLKSIEDKRELQKKRPSYPWQTTGLQMRGGSRIRNTRGFMEPSTRWWEVYFDIDRESWMCAKHPTLQKVLDYLVRKAGGVQYASLQSRRNILTAVAIFCRHYNLTPEAACKLSPGELSSLVQEFCDKWMNEGKIATAQRHLMGLATFFDKNSYAKRSERALAFQNYQYQPTFKVPTWKGSVDEYKPNVAEVWKIASCCGSTLEGLRDKSIALFGFGTGCRNSDIRAFQYGRTYHFKNLAFNIKEELASWDGKAPLVIPVTLELKLQVPDACKWRRQHYTLLFPEAVQALKDYLAERQRLYGPIGDAEPLFASRGNNLGEAYWRSKPMSASTLCRIIKIAARRAFQSDSKKAERWRGVHPHVFKNCFLDVLDHGDALTGTQILSQNDKAFVMGHRLPGSMDSYYTADKLEELKEKWVRLAWTEHVPAFTPVELRKRQLFDMMQFLGVPEDVQNHVKTLAAEWGKPEDFDRGLPLIRRLLEGKSVNAADLESIPGYHLQLQDGKAYIGTTEWRRQQVRQPSQQVVEIETLTNHLQEGWRFISTLPNGKCVIERTR